ncbi:hypothetical protein M406DRAFT_249148 [Cryphonectria parasitica EP155]|uniref:Uncharacterized protein n=1 Tax=Cryphonectria parasitica (strain ATCC 38755 / EP155) TaxID=660469 RepID=A0A9P5CSI4_CRYP1|nr:uncharacterized protein M406DRAFT_249148 [Cryphonectria parasitica EP155]KAF3768366.1 hypothetical protein M406DRAFT_249148 [Cryphonectria parasitica EP155]
MLNRINKSRSSYSMKTQEHHRLAELISAFGIEMPACAHCWEMGAFYCFAENSSRCEECVSLNQSCDTGCFSASAAGRLIREKRKVLSEEAEAELANAAALQALLASQACLDCVRKQRRLLEERAAEMIRCSFNSLEGFADEEDRNLCKEKTCLMSQGHLEVIDWSSLAFDPSMSGWPSLLESETAAPDSRSGVERSS